MIGQRWKDISEDELAKYKALANEDSERYKAEMKAFYNEELALMCRGQGGGDDANVASGTVASSSGAASLPIPVNGNQGRIATNANDPGAMDDQVLNFLLQSDSSIPIGQLMNLITNQKASIQQRQQKLYEELQTLQLKKEMLDNILATKTAGLHATGAAGLAAPSSSGILPIQQQQQLTGLGISGTPSLATLGQQQTAQASAPLSSLVGGSITPSSSVGAGADMSQDQMLSLLRTFMNGNQP